MATIPNNEPLLSTPHEKPIPPRPHFTRKLATKMLATTIIATGAYALYINQQQFNHQIQTLNNKIWTLDQQQINSKIQFETQLNSLTPIEKTLNARLDAVNKNISRALEEKGYQANDWLLLKARYYLELAEINARWSEDQQTTVVLFKQADNLLVNIHQPELYTLRQTIAREIAQLQAIPPVDMIGLLASLDAAQTSITHLPLKNSFVLNGPTVTETNEMSSIWRNKVQKSIQMLKKLIVIRHHEGAIEPLQSPEYESLLRETCFLNLQEAQWAVIQRNQAIFKLSLTQAINTIKRAFDLASPATQTLLQQLNALQSNPLNSQKISTGESLSLLNQLIESKKNPINQSPEESESAPLTDVKSPSAGANL